MKAYVFLNDFLVKTTSSPITQDNELAVVVALSIIIAPTSLGFVVSLQLLCDVMYNMYGSSSCVYNSIVIIYNKYYNCEVLICACTIKI